MRARSSLDRVSFAGFLDAARHGDEAAITQLFLDLHPRLVRYLRSAEPKAADDLAGEVWVALATGLRSFEGDLHAFRSWAFVIARRRLADYRRNSGRRRTDPVASVEPFADHSRSPDSADIALEQLSVHQAVDLIASLLPADMAEVVLLRVLGDLDVASVAKVVGRTPNWVRVTQHRALRRLAAGLPEHGAGRMVPIVLFL